MRDSGDAHVQYHIKHTQGEIHLVQLEYTCLKSLRPAPTRLTRSPLTLQPGLGGMEDGMAEAEAVPVVTGEATETCGYACHQHLYFLGTGRHLQVEE